MVQVLNSLDSFSSNQSEISGFQTSDDCAIYKLNNEETLLQTVDFFTPIVNDPFDFGRIAAANSLSDIYAMAGKPIFALNIVGFPSDDLDLDILTEILKGGQEIANKAGIPVLGGHTIKDKEPKYGMAVTGLAPKCGPIQNCNSKVGDLLIITKPLGTGIISTAIKKEICPSELLDIAVKTMTELNDSASLNMQGITNACTDITGYGLLGHLNEMCLGSGVSAVLNYDAIPFISGVKELAKEGVIPGGTKKNFDFISNTVEFANDIKEYQKLMIADAQTSGGLLLSCTEKNANDFIKIMNDKGNFSKIIGHVIDRDDNNIIVK